MNPRAQVPSREGQVLRQVRPSTCVCLGLGVLRGPLRNVTWQIATGGGCSPPMGALYRATGKEGLGPALVLVLEPRFLSQDAIHFDSPTTLRLVWNVVPEGQCFRFPFNV